MNAQGSVLTLTDRNFPEMIARSQGLALVDFWAPWCGPCHVLSPAVEKMAVAYAGKVKVGKVDIDENPGLATAFGITSIPTLLFFRDGKLVDRVVGVIPETALRARLDRALEERETERTGT